MSLRVKIQILRGDTVVMEIAGDALKPQGWAARDALHEVVEDSSGKRRLVAFGYDPAVMEKRWGRDSKT